MVDNLFGVNAYNRQKHKQNKDRLKKYVATIPQTESINAFILSLTVPAISN